MKLCYQCGTIATWMYMPGNDDDFFCDACVPRGCSCNNESIVMKNDGNDEDLKEQCEKLKKEVNENFYYLKNYGKKQHCCGEEIEIIKDINEVRKRINSLKDEEFLNYTFVPLDDQNREFPCCEYEYEENGFSDKGY